MSATKAPAKPAAKSLAVAKPISKPLTKPLPKTLAPTATASAAKPAEKPVSQVKAAAPKTAQNNRAAKTITKVGTKVKAVKVKPVRDSFTFPKDEYAQIDVLKKRAVKLGHSSKKSELLRAGIKALSAMPEAGFLAAIQSVPAIKTGRPRKN